MIERVLLAVVVIPVVMALHRSDRFSERDSKALSGLRSWVDPATPEDRWTYESARSDGRVWELVMSDEFDTPDRVFRAGEDHVWTSLEKPDGVNAALEVYAHNQTTTKCDTVTGDCYLEICVEERRSDLRVWNAFADPPDQQNVTFVRFCRPDVVALAGA